MSHNPSLPLSEQPGFIPLSSSLKPDEETALAELSLVFPHWREVLPDIWRALARRQGYELVAVVPDGGDEYISSGGLKFYGRPIETHDQTQPTPEPEAVDHAR